MKRVDIIKVNGKKVYIKSGISNKQLVRVVVNNFQKKSKKRRRREKKNVPKADFSNNDLAKLLFFMQLNKQDKDKKEIAQPVLQAQPVEIAQPILQPGNQEMLLLRHNRELIDEISKKDEYIRSLQERESERAKSAIDNWIGIYFSKNSRIKQLRKVMKKFGIEDIYDELYPDSSERLAKKFILDVGIVPKGDSGYFDPGNLIKNINHEKLQKVRENAERLLQEIYNKKHQ